MFPTLTSAVVRRSGSLAAFGRSLQTQSVLNGPKHFDYANPPPDPKSGRKWMLRNPIKSLLLLTGICIIPYEMFHPDREERQRKYKNQWYNGGVGFYQTGRDKKD